MIKPFTLQVSTGTIRKMPENYCVAIWLEDRHRWVLDMDKAIEGEQADLIFHSVHPMSGNSWHAGCDWVDALNVAWTIKERWGQRFTMEPVKTHDDLLPFILCEQNHRYYLVGAGLTYVPLAGNIREALQYARLVKRIYDADLLPWKVAKRNLNKSPDYFTVQRKINAARVAFWPALQSIPA